jgi:glucosamine-6-phosphate deaminase
LDIATRINEVIRAKGNATVVFAAAPSQSEMLRYLCEQDVDWSKVYAMHQDEYVGLPSEAEQGFGISCGGPFLTGSLSEKYRSCRGLATIRRRHVAFMQSN